jgi:transposase
MPVKYDQDTKAKAVRLVCERAGDYESEWAAISAVAGRIALIFRAPSRSGGDAVT